MKDSQQVLSSVLKTAQMGQVGIRSVLQMPVQELLRKSLESDLQNYDTIEKRALDTARERGWEVKNLDPGLRRTAGWMAKMKLYFGDLDSRAAAMMIHGNVRGIIKGCRNLNAYDHTDSTVTGLSRMLLETEQQSSKNMQRFL